MSQNKLKKVNIKIPGAWNTRLFIPEWLTEKLNLEENPKFEKKIGVGANFVERDFSFQFCGISLQPKDSVLIIEATDLQNIDEMLTFSFNVAMKLVTTLCHTPITGMGLNFHYEIYEPQTDFVKRLLSGTKINDFFLTQHVFTKKEESHSINIFGFPKTSEYDKCGLLIFNFHYEPSQISNILNCNTFIEDYLYVKGVLNE